MLLAGDEAGRSQRGNNNAYCQDSPLSWFDWTLTDQNADLLRFVRHVVAFRRAHPALRQTGTVRDRRVSWFPALSWHGTRAWAPDWAPQNRLLAWMHRFADTSARSPEDAAQPGSEPVLPDQASIQIRERSAVALVAHHRSLGKRAKK
jgi:glycogen operon protein